jgi:hypothetical protein
LTQTGDSNLQVAHATNINIILPGVPQAGGAPVGASAALNLDYFNLFVTIDEPFEATGHFMMMTSRALTESMLPEVKAEFSSLSEGAIARIKTFPSLFANENFNFAEAGDDQYAFFGIVTNVRVQDNGIKVYYQLYSAIPQQRLNEIQDKLALEYATSFNELNRTHWSIKRINLIEELTEAGISVLAPT